MYCHAQTANIDALIAIGGDDTLSVAQKLHEKGVKVVGVPKTIDNDLAGTDFTFGFDTAVNIATEAIDRVHTTAEAHNRVMVVEVMGRDAGWIAMYSGIAGGADVILIPEKPFDVDQVAETIRLRHARGRYFSIVVVAEGARFSTDVDPKQGGLATVDTSKDEFGHARLGGIAGILAREIEGRTGFETRTVVLGHVQRGGSPSAFDRMLATRYGLGAIDMVHRGEFGCMAALRGNKIISVPLKDAIAKNRTVDQETIDVASGILDKLTTDKVGVGEVGAAPGNRIRHGILSTRFTSSSSPLTAGMASKVRRLRSEFRRPDDNGRILRPPRPRNTRDH